MDNSEFRKLGHRTVDMLADYLATVEEKPLFPNVTPRELAEIYREPLPREPMPSTELLDEIERNLLPYSTHVNHPGYFGLMTPTPTTMGILGDFIASTLNQNLGTYTIGPAAIAVERQTVRWLTDLVGYGPLSGGNLTSGGMVANLIGLKLGRDWASEDRAQHQGVRGRWAAYASEERHVSVDKAIDVLGLGREGLRILPTDDQFQLRLDALETAIAEDKAQGIQPMCLIGIAGTTNTGSVDPLVELRRIADRERMWLHVDAAYGGGVLLSERRAGILKGLEAADSVTLDPHKWFYAPLDAGAVLVRDETRLTSSFGMKPSYLTDEMDTGGERYQYYVHGLEQSRRFRSLKVWLGFKRYGTSQIGDWIDANIEQTEHLYDLCERSADFRALMKPLMSGICVRYDPGGIDEDRLAAIHRTVARRAEQGGRFWFSTTSLKGRSAFRINPINLRTRMEHMDELFALLQRECDRARAEN